MSNYIRIIRLILFCMLSIQAMAFSGLPQHNDSLQITFTKQTVPQKQFKEDLSTVYTERSFDYNTVESESQNILSRLLSWLFNWLSDTFGIQLSPNVFKVVETIFYILMIIGAVYSITKLLFGERVSVFRPKQQKAMPLTVEEETIETVDLDASIREAISQQQYRLAIRYLHLKVLQQLSQRELITWHSEKTNMDYYKELKIPVLKNGFQKTAYVYDYVWYGEFAIDEGSFEKAKHQFDQFLAALERYG